MRILVSLFSLVLACAVVQHGTAQAPLQVDLDTATFAYDEDESLVEVYLAFGVTSLSYERSDQGYRAGLPIQLALVPSGAAAPGEPVWEHATQLHFTVPDTAALQRGSYFVHQLRAAVPPGEYELRLEIPPAEARRRQLELRRDVRVPDFSEGARPGLSGVTLATTIEPSTDREDTFYKNGLLVRPNPNQLYGTRMNQLYYYTEAYHADALAGTDGTYTVRAYVSGANRELPVEGLDKRLEREARSPDILLGTFDIGGLPNGSYVLHLALLDETGAPVAEQERKFFVYNPDVARTQPLLMEENFETSTYASMEEAEVRQMLEQIDLIATDAERRRAKGIQDLNEQRRFLMDFWKRRDPSPSTPLNEFKEEFLRRVYFANERYPGSYMEGWKTDRGRTLIKYGTPVEIDSRLYEASTRPYEIWRYDNIPGEGQAFFVFADRSGFGRFELLHSSVSGEVKLSNWQEMLRR